METWLIVGQVFTGCLIFYIGLLEKRLSDMQVKIDKSAKSEDVEKLIDLKVDTVVNEQVNLKEDLGRIEAKVDKLLDKLTSSVIK